MNFTAYHELAEESPVASFIFNLTEEKLIYGNPALFSLLQVDEKAFTLNYLKNLIHRDDHSYVQKALSEVESGTLKSYVQFRIVLEQETRWLRVMASLSKRNQSGMVIYGNAIDVTAELTNQSNFEKFANKKDAILTILAHDLTGPLSVINMLGSSLRSSIQNPADVQRIDSILKINKQATDLIREFTAREFLETTDIVLAKKRVNISQKVKEYVEEYQNPASEINRTFKFFTQPEDIFLTVDEGKFFQIMNNLITNALKFTNEKGNISVSIEDKNDFVLFAVKDDGIGIPQQYHDILFDKFTDARRKGLQGEPSIGLGMYVVKNIIDWHKGKVCVDSTENVGTTVYFEIPKF